MAPASSSARSGPVMVTVPMSASMSAMASPPSSPPSSVASVVSVVSSAAVVAVSPSAEVSASESPLQAPAVSANANMRASSVFNREDCMRSTFPLASEGRTALPRNGFVSPRNRSCVNACSASDVHPSRARRSRHDSPSRMSQTPRSSGDSPSSQRCRSPDCNMIATCRPGRRADPGRRRGSPARRNGVVATDWGRLCPT